MPTGRNANVVGVLPAGTQLLEYEIRSVLGKPGGFGITYLAHDSHLLHEFAIKEYLPVEFAVRSPEGNITPRSDDDAPAFDWGMRCFINEARLLARFRHPHVVQVYRYFEDRGTAYMVLEYVRGQTLAEDLRLHPSPDQARVKAFLLPLLDGLDAVHRAGVLHRDLKPENIILRDERNPVLIDFGAARGALGVRSRSLMGVLTAGYAPIEQYSQNGKQGPWTDIYAMAAVLYRALTGGKPPDVVDRLNSDPMMPLAQLEPMDFNPKFLRAVDWGLRVQPEQRPQSVAEWRQALLGEAEVRAISEALPDAEAPVDFDLGGDQETPARSASRALSAPSLL
jgi:serine/threonine protein kinase